jgi:DNA gyrase subunit A
MFITDGGKVLRTRVSDLSIIGRNTQGVRLMVLEPGERIVAVAKLAEKEEDNGIGEIEKAAPEGGAEEEQTDLE